MEKLFFSSSFIPSDASPRLLTLMVDSIERIISRHPEPQKLIAQFSPERIRHIVDWLVASDLSDASWIHRVDGRGVPKKLAKCGSLDRLHVEADKAMRREAQRAIARLAPAKAGEGEELVKVLNEGWTLVRLLTPEALDRESAAMGHCVGGGAYDDGVVSGKRKIYSLRNAAGKPRITIELGQNFQVAGRENSPPAYEDFARVEQFLLGENFTHAMITKIYFYPNQVTSQDEELILKRQDAKCANSYARDVLKGPWPVSESFIKKDPGSAFGYAKVVLKRRWPEAEDVIKTDAQSSYLYAHDVLKSPWPEAEHIIRTEAESARLYASYLLMRRWPEAEAVIKTNARQAFFYVQKVLKAPWPDAESVIKTDAEVAFLYSKDILKRPWPEGEESIKKNVAHAFYYAKYVLGGPWPEAEKIIKKHPVYADLYAEFTQSVISPHG